ncbi:MAG: NADH-quinone oxidoreductase subunit NuoF [Chloroflexi bacterium]|nr:NADH-quinone oxidoreductase subunit NuoF [Chloroflexota bacterium]
MNKFEVIKNQALEKWDTLFNSDTPVIYLGAASCGKAAGAMEVLSAIQETLKEIQKPANIVQVGCIGPCYLEPLMDIALPGLPRVSYANVSPQNAKKIIKAAFIDGDLKFDLAVGHFGDDRFTKKTGLPRFFDLPMLKPQVRIILRNCGFIDPEDIDQYIARGGYQGFFNALSASSQDVINEVKISGIRGRGGAGFPTYKKWEISRDVPGPIKYVVCNADEGDPGAFMNRSLLEGDPHAVLEGMLIAAYAIGATSGYIYVRAEYPLAVIRLKTAINQMKEYGLLGMNILGSGFNFDISVKEGAGAFVCGEETALIASLEGERGMPRPRPPYPAEVGLHGRPTVINNTETFGTLPNILRNGGKWYSQFGKAGNTGTKTFSLVGKARYTGLIEVPLGMTLREIVFDIGGGTKKPFKAVQTGGPLGGCLSSALLDTPVDYESMSASGSIMGSGGLIVMDESTCLVDLARYFQTFSKNESCGKCTACRTGSRILVDTLDKIVRGEGDANDIGILYTVADTMQKTAMCGAGQTAPNPVLSTIRYFLSEYHAHILDKYCPSAVCTELFDYTIDPSKCPGCGRCIKVCPSQAITGEKKQPHVLDVSKCVKCKNCVNVCKFDAIVGMPRSKPEKRETFSEITL